MIPVDELATRPWASCRTGATRLGEAELAHLVSQLGMGWEIVSGHHLRKRFPFAGFAAGLAFVNRIGALAEALDHHPEVRLRWGEVTIEIWTHTVDGLCEADFVWAARAQQIAGEG